MAGAIERVRPPLAWLGCLSLILYLAIGVASSALAETAGATTGKHDYIEILSPRDRELLPSTPVAVDVRFSVPVKQESFKAQLNGHNVTARFRVGQDGAQASLTQNDGVRLSRSDTSRRSNVLHVWIRSDGSTSRIYHAKRIFFVKAGPAQQVSEIVTPAGGMLSLPGIGEISFPAGAFATDTNVQLSMTTDSKTQETFQETSVVLAAASRLPYELRVTTGNAQPLMDARVSFTVPASFRAAAPLGSEVRVFAENLWQDPDEALDTFEVFPDRFSTSEETVTASVSRSFFTNSLRADGAFELVTLLATTPTAAITSASATSAEPPRQTAKTTAIAPLQQQAGQCQGATLDPPLDGELHVTSPFGQRVHPITGVVTNHWGTDLDAPNGTAVHAMADGTVETVAVNQHVAAGGRVTGWGQYVVVRHDDGSRTLYAHLENGSPVPVGTRVEAGDVIARSDTTGGATGPHLHIEYAPNGQIFNNASKVDPMPCIGGNVTGSITVRDNGPLADDAFSVAIDGLVVCTTDVGASNTCAVGNLRPGEKTLTLTAVIAPDNVGTFEITLGDRLTFLDGSTDVSGVISQGESVSYQIIVPAG
jgi:murein DD-endopeptidase MepM/ murein hydrolase activator NlpD